MSQLKPARSVKRAPLNPWEQKRKAIAPALTVEQRVRLLEAAVQRLQELVRLR